MNEEAYIKIIVDAEGQSKTELRLKKTDLHTLGIFITNLELTKLELLKLFDKDGYDADPHKNS
jgi:hypothetical protein